MACPPCVRRYFCKFFAGPQPIGDVGNEFFNRNFPSCTFPNNQNTPAAIDKTLNRCLIALSVGAKFFLPEFPPCLGKLEISTAFVRVPKTPMYKNCCPILAQHKIRFSRQFLSVKPETVPTGVESAPDDEFRLRVFVPDPRHHL